VSGAGSVKVGNRACEMAPYAGAIPLTARSAANTLGLLDPTAIVPPDGGRDGAAALPAVRPDHNATGSDAEGDTISVAPTTVVISIATDLHVDLRHLEFLRSGGRRSDQQWSGCEQGRGAGYGENESGHGGVSPWVNTDQLERQGSDKVPMLKRRERPAQI
jgi:hypothetical protein